jgi:hypothetical protein
MNMYMSRDGITEMKFFNAFLVEVSGHKLKSSQTRVFVWFSTIVLPFYKRLFRECMHRRFIIKKTWLSAFSFAQSHISLAICRSLSFLVPWFSSLIDKTDLADFVCLWGGLCLFVCKNYISLSLISLNIFFAM